MSLPTPYYDEGGITIYHADCRDILPHLPKVDLVLTDPPYGIGFASQPTKWQRRAGRSAEYWDDEPIDSLEFILKVGRYHIIWGGNYYSLFPSRAWLSWFKPDAPPSMGHFEVAWTDLDQCTRQISWSIRATNSERVGHPTQKPLEVMKWAITQAPGDCRMILDPFAGSGTTGVAAKELGRQCILIEVEEKYCAIAVERLRQEVLNL